jgi:hypothetical protein
MLELAQSLAWAQKELLASGSFWIVGCQLSWLDWESQCLKPNLMAGWGIKTWSLNELELKAPTVEYPRLRVLIITVGDWSWRYTCKHASHARLFTAALWFCFCFGGGRSLTKESDSAQHLVFLQWMTSKSGLTVKWIYPSEGTV